jgi:hypothetical protein
MIEREPMEEDDSPVSTIPEIATVKDLIAELVEFAESKDAWDAPVMIAVIKYPEEFQVKIKNGKASWTDSTDVEVQPLERGEVTMQDSCCMIAVELTDYDEQRHIAGG